MPQFPTWKWTQLFYLTLSCLINVWALCGWWWSKSWLLLQKLTANPRLTCPDPGECACQLETCNSKVSLSRGCSTTHPQDDSYFLWNPIRLWWFRHVPHTSFFFLFTTNPESSRFCQVLLEGEDKELPAKLASPKTQPLQKAPTVSSGWCKLQSLHCLFCSKAFHAHCPLLKIPNATPGPALHEHSRPFSCIRQGFLSLNRSCRRLQTHVFPLFLAYSKSKKLLKQITKDT